MLSIRGTSFTAERTVIPARESVSVLAVNEKLEPIRNLSSERLTFPVVPNEALNMLSILNFIVEFRSPV